jgi:hypothetical protein
MAMHAVLAVAGFIEPELDERLDVRQSRLT